MPQHDTALLPLGDAADPERCVRELGAALALVDRRLYAYFTGAALPPLLRAPAASHAAAPSAAVRRARL